MPTHARRHVQPEQTTLAPARPQVTPVSNSDMQDQLLASKASESQSVLQGGPEVDSNQEGAAAITAPTPSLRRGDRGEGVRQLQSAWVGLGFMSPEQQASGPGIFGPLTERATRGFQASRGLAADGIYGSRTAGALVAESVGRASSSSAPEGELRQGDRGQTEDESPGPEEASPERELADLKTPENAAPIIDQYRMNHEWNDGFCGLATVISTLEANGRGEWNIHDRGTLSRLASRMYLRGQGSSGALMAKHLRAFGEAHATFTAAGSVGQLMGTLAGGRPVPVGFVSMGGEVVEAPRTSLRYGVLKPGDHHEHIFGPSGHWATVVGFEGPAEAPTHFLVNDSDTGAQLRMSRGDFERHTDARNGIWMIPY